MNLFHEKFIFKSKFCCNLSLLSLLGLGRRRSVTLSARHHQHQARRLSTTAGYAGGAGLCSTICCCGCFGNSNQDKSKENPETIRMLLLGLDNAGKTSVALRLSGDSVEDVVTTIGFSNYELKPSKPSDPFRYILYDLGGGQRIRSIWKNYFALVHGVIFVIDASDLDRIADVKESLATVIAHEKIAGKPILIFLNKQDMYDAMDEIDICKCTNLEELVSRHQCVTKIEAITANNPTDPTLIDHGIERGFRWMAATIEENWPQLNVRVAADSRLQIESERQAMRERIQKVQLKEQQEKRQDALRSNHEGTIITEQPRPESLFPGGGAHPRRNSKSAFPTLSTIDEVSLSQTPTDSDSRDQAISPVADLSNTSLPNSAHHQHQRSASLTRTAIALNGQVLEDEPDNAHGVYVDSTAEPMPGEAWNEKKIGAKRNKVHPTGL